MQCPHCKYTYGWNWPGDGKEAQIIKDELGKFYKLSIKVERDTYYGEDEKSVYACPKCGILFVEVQ